MDSAFDSVDQSTSSLITDLQSNLVLIKLIAEDVERAAQDCDEVKLLDDAVLELITATNELERHRNAMQTLKASYKFSPNEPTDFTKKCEEEMSKLPATNPKEHAFYKQFQEAIWNVRNAGIPMPGDEQVDIMCTTQAGIVNKTCLISGKHVTELQNPVRCKECRHIYEFEAAKRYLGKRRSKQCAAAGCPKHISLENLVKDSTLEMEIAELKMRDDGNCGGTVVEELDDILDLELE